MQNEQCENYKIVFSLIYNENISILETDISLLSFDSEKLFEYNP